MPFIAKPRRTSTSTRANAEADFLQVDTAGRRYFWVAGGLPDQPLGELETEAEKDRAIADAAKPRKIYVGGSGSGGGW